MNFLDDIKDYLDSFNLGFTIFETNMPPEPVNNITLYEFGGPPVDYDSVDSPGLQLLLRTDSDNYSQLYDALQLATKKLLMIGAEDGFPEGKIINNNLYLRIYEEMSGVIPLGQDENGNHLMSKNFYVIRSV